MNRAVVTALVATTALVGAGYVLRRRTAQEAAPSRVIPIITPVIDLGVEADGQWGPKTEDAIQAALGTGGCTDEACPAPTAPGGPSTDALQGMGRLGWGLIAGVTLTGVAIGVTLALRGARA